MLLGLITWFYGLRVVVSDLRKKDIENKWIVIFNWYSLVLEGSPYELSESAKRKFYKTIGFFVLCIVLCFGVAMLIDYLKN